MSKVYKSRIPLAAAAARSQQDRDTFFGGKSSALSSSKIIRPIGKDRRSAEALASASAPIVANRASAAPKAEPVEKEMDDKIESTVSKLAEPAKDVNEGAPSPVANQSFKGMDSAGQTVLEDAPAKPKGIIESMMERFPNFAEAYKGMAEQRAMNDILKEMDRAKMSQKSADFLGFMKEKPVKNPVSIFVARGKN